MIISKFLLAAILAWITAQILKYVITLIFKSNSRALHQLYLSGGMPSAHSATTTAITTTIGLTEGVSSAIFALSALLNAIVIYDAAMVRRSSGEQGEVLSKLIKVTKSQLKPPFVARGHTVYEVTAGFILGVIVGFTVVYYF